MLHFRRWTNSGDVSFLQDGYQIVPGKSIISMLLGYNQAS